MNKLLNCPFCGNEVNWCACGDESDDHTGCHQITCQQCGNFDFANGINEIDTETLGELRDCMTEKWNARTGSAKPN